MAGEGAEAVAEAMGYGKGSGGSLIENDLVIPKSLITNLYTGNVFLHVGADRIFSGCNKKFGCNEKYEFPDVIENWNLRM